jgi:serine/threonine-protein kinase
MPGVAKDPLATSGASRAAVPGVAKDPLAASGASRAAAPGVAKDPLAASGASRAAAPGVAKDPLAASGASRAAAPDPLAVSGASPAAELPRDRPSSAGAALLCGALDEPGPGSTVAGRYLLERVIGRGGMGSVWVGRDLTLEIDVAIKLIRRDRAAPEARGRLLQEARAAARIGHPSIVRIFDFGESAEGDPFIVMEHLNGESLSGVLLRRQRLAPLVAVSTLLPVASALVAAHAKGIVHRDLKPDNILLVTNEAGALVPKLLDFGIARLLDTDTERRFTLAGEVLGSPDYMSPEQARGEVDVGAATDIWAFTVLIYEAITGQRPFHGVNYNKLILAIITAEPTPTTDLAAGDAELWAILERGLAKDVCERWPSMRELGAALAAWAVERGLQDDVAGTSLASHWLAGTRRRALSVHPPDPGAPEASVPPSSAASTAPAPMPAAALPSEVMDRPPFVPNRKRWLVVSVIVVCAALGALAYLSRDDPPADRPGPAASAPALLPGAPADPKATAAPAPSAEASTAASAPPPATPPGGRGTWKPRKPTAPPAPKNITF